MDFLFWTFVAFHLSSVVLCISATRSTCRYLSKHRVLPKARYLLFGFLRIRHLALAYLIIIFGISGYSLIRGIFYMM